MRITDSVYMLSGSPYALIGNVYAILSEEKVILIDAGENQEALDVILDSMAYFGLDKYPVTDVLITHMHADHSGNAWYFKEKGARIMSSEADASGIETGGVRVNDFGNKNYIPCKVDRHIADGEHFCLNGVEFDAYLVPGHTDGSMYFRFVIDGKSFLCTGDTVLPEYGGKFGGPFVAALGWMGSYEMDKKNEKS